MIELNGKRCIEFFSDFFIKLRQHKKGNEVQLFKQTFALGFRRKGPKMGPRLKIPFKQAFYLKEGDLGFGF